VASRSRPTSERDRRRAGRTDRARNVRDLRARTRLRTDGFAASDGVSLVLGTYSSDLFRPGQHGSRRRRDALLGDRAVADRLTGRGSRSSSASGEAARTSGTNSASFAAQELAPRLGRAPSQLPPRDRVRADDYASSVADAAASTASAAGRPDRRRITYDLVLPGWSAVMRQLAAARPDVIILASHIPDGVAFRRP